jgi:hypothetical protein
MAGQSFRVEPVTQVIGGRIEPTDDYWGGTRSISPTRPTSTSAHADPKTTRTGPKLASSAIATCAA